jgi:nucleotide-binding universal stress UspA family protein
MATRTLIVGIDYSDFCIPALDEALRMTAASPATRLVTLLALPQASPSRSEQAKSTTDEFTERAQENLVRLVQERAVSLGLPPPQSVPLVCFGGAAECLLTQARELTADLILLGTHSRQGLGHLLMGSVAEEVVQRAPCSVLVARARSVPATERATLEAPRGGRAGSAEDFARDDAAAASAQEGSARIELLGEPHLDAGRVVLHVLDVRSGQTFVCSFRDFSSVSVEPLEGQWVPQPTSDERARAARFALEEARLESGLFERLFEELARRAHAR